MVGLLAACGSTEKQENSAGNEESVPATGEVKEVTVVGKTGDNPEDFTFEPAEVVVNKGDTVQLTLDSEGGVPHGLLIPGLNVKVEENQTAEFVASQAGEYLGKCTVLCGVGHATMPFKIIVK